MGSNDPELGPQPSARPPANAAGGYLYRKGRYTPLDTVDGLVTNHVAINNRGQIAIIAPSRHQPTQRPWAAWPDHRQP